MGMSEAQAMSYVLLPMETPPIDLQHPERYIVKGVRDRVGMHPSTIYAEIKAGRFPRPVKLGRSSRWLESEIDAYIAERVSERDQQGAISSSDESQPVMPRLG